MEIGEVFPDFSERCSRFPREYREIKEGQRSQLDSVLFHSSHVFLARQMKRPQGIPPKFSECLSITFANNGIRRFGYFLEIVREQAEARRNRLSPNFPAENDAEGIDSDRNNRRLFTLLARFTASSPALADCPCTLRYTLYI